MTWSTILHSFLSLTGHFHPTHAFKLSANRFPIQSVVDFLNFKVNHRSTVHSKVNRQCRRLEPHYTALFISPYLVQVNHLFHYRNVCLLNYENSLLTDDDDAAAHGDRLHGSTPYHLITITATLFLRVFRVTNSTKKKRHSPIIFFSAHFDQFLIDCFGFLSTKSTWLWPLHTK